nr:TonB-dependent receptor [Sphingomonas formosensis]
MILLAGAIPAALQAQGGAEGQRSSAHKPSTDYEDEDTIVVNGAGQKLPGSVIGDIPPEVTIGQAEIRSYGVSTITDLLNELSPETESGRGRGGESPVVLLNGKRISSLSEIRDIPTEAIMRVEILPEEVALKYGYPANQKVVNVVLRRRFRALTGEFNGTTTTDGGGETGKADASLLRIRGDNRFTLDLNYQASARLLESQRDIADQGRSPYAYAGNVTGAGGGAIDPALSALVGGAPSIAGVPNTMPTLADFAATAGRVDMSDITRARTLSPASDQFSANAVLARTIFGNVSATINGSFGASGSTALRGPASTLLTVPAGDPFSPFSNDVLLNRYLDGTALRQHVAGETAHLGFTLNGDLAKWRWTVTGNYDFSDTRTTTQRGVDVSAIQDQLDALSLTLNPFGALPSNLIGMLPADKAHATSNTGNIQAVLMGKLASVPAGDLSTSIKFGNEASWFDTRSTRSGTVNLSRNDANAQINLDLPITSRRNNFLAAIGDLSANFNGAIDRVSDFGTLTTIGYGVTWKPRTNLTLIWSVTHDQGAPTVQQLGNPQVETFDVRVFDYVRGQTASVTQIDGGNASLKHDDRRITKLGFTFKPFKSTDLSFTANYIRSRIRNAIASLPAPTAQIEAAFPDHFIRDDEGNLVTIDNRPVNFAREDREQLRWGFNFSKRLKTSQKVIDAFRALRESGALQFPRRDGAEGGPPGGEANRNFGAGGSGSGGSGTAGGGQGGANAGGGPGGGGPGGGGGFGGGRGGFGGRGGGGGGALQFAVYHTWLFRDDMLVREGVPVIDLLNGGATGNSGGAPRHKVEVQAGYSNNGLGARLSVNWQSGTTVTGGTGSSALGDLRFSSLGTANLRLFANLGQIPSLMKNRWARGMRVTLSVTNLTNQRIRVRDASGETPLSYQPDYLDPLGRQIRLSIRKLLF